MQPYTVVICDDEPVFAGQLERAACRALEEAQVVHSITVYDNAKQMLSALEGKSPWPALFLLDIMMKPVNGMEAARKLRQQGARSTIVFITSTSDFAVTGYEVGAYRYLLKPVDEHALSTLIAKDYARWKARTAATMTFSIGTQIHRIPCDAILFIEVEGRGVRVHTRAESIFAPQKISEISEQLPRDGLMRCHQSFIVNIRHVRLLRRYEAVIGKEHIIPVSKAYFAEVKAVLVRYVEDR